MVGLSWGRPGLWLATSMGPPGRVSARRSSTLKRDGPRSGNIRKKSETTGPLSPLSDCADLLETAVPTPPWGRTRLPEGVLDNIAFPAPRWNGQPLPGSAVWPEGRFLSLMMGLLVNGKRGL